MRIEPERNAVARAVLKVGRDVFEDLQKQKGTHYSNKGILQQKGHT